METSFRGWVNNLNHLLASIIYHYISGGITIQKLILYEALQL